MQHQDNVDRHEMGSPNDINHSTGHQKDRNDKFISEGGESTLKPPNNKMQEKLSKKKRDAIKRRQQKEAEQMKNHDSTPLKQQAKVDSLKDPTTLNTIPRINDDYDVVNSEHEFDQDTRFMEENVDEEEETSTHLIKAFGSTMHRDVQEEVQEIIEKQGLSPRGLVPQKQNNQQPTTSTSANSSRPNTRSKSRGL